MGKKRKGGEVSGKDRVFDKPWLLVNVIERR